MEVKETAACGISLREFAIEFDTLGLVNMYRILLYAQEGIGFYEEDFLEDVKLQMSYIIGPSLEEKPPSDIAEGGIHWEDTGSSYDLTLNETGAQMLYQILLAVENPGEGFGKTLSQKLIDGMMEMAPSVLENLPMTNR